MTSPVVRLFYVSNRQDLDLQGHLDRQLKLVERRGLLHTWSRQDTMAGQEWQALSEQNLAAANLILLLVTKDLTASDYHWHVEMKQALELHEQRKARVIPILLRPVAGWESGPFGKLECLPRNGRPLSLWDDRDRGFAEVAEEIMAVVESLAGQPISSESPAQPDEGEPKSLTSPPVPASLEPAVLRSFLEQVLGVESDFIAFCEDNFPAAASRFSSGMDRTAKMTLLLQIVRRDGEQQKLLVHLKQQFPKAYECHERKLR